jgi:hypothetical protein
MFKLITITTVTGAIAFAGLFGQLNAKVDPPLCSEQEAVAIAKEFLRSIGLDNERLYWSHAKIELDRIGYRLRWQILLPRHMVLIEPRLRKVHFYDYLNTIELAPAKTPRSQWAAGTDEQALRIATRFARDHGLPVIAPRVEFASWYERCVEPPRIERGREYVVVTDVGHRNSEIVFGNLENWSVSIDRASGRIMTFSEFPPLRFDRAPVRLSVDDARDKAVAAFVKLKPNRPTNSVGGELGWSLVRIVDGEEVIESEWRPRRVRLAYRFSFEEGFVQIYVDANNGEVIRTDVAVGVPNK